jgi:hypothetical protein
MMKSRNMSQSSPRAVVEKLTKVAEGDDADDENDDDDDDDDSLVLDKDEKKALREIARNDVLAAKEAESNPTSAPISPRASDVDWREKRVDYLELRDEYDCRMIAATATALRTTTTRMRGRRRSGRRDPRTRPTSGTPQTTTSGSPRRRRSQPQWSR